MIFVNYHWVEDRTAALLLSGIANRSGDLTAHSSASLAEGRLPMATLLRGLNPAWSS